MRQYSAARSIALVYNSDFYLYRFRGGLIRALREQGYQVYAITPPGGYIEALEQAGAEFIPWRLARGSANPWRELRSLLNLRRVLGRIRPAVAHNFTLKANIYGAIAARTAGVPTVVASVNGLGYPFVNSTLKARAIGRVLRPIYRLSFALSDTVTFQNKDDRDVMIGLGLLPEDKARYIPGGSGVDLSYFSPEALDMPSLDGLRRELELPPDGAEVIVLVSRMLWDKGVGEFVASARNLRENRPHARFLLVGPTDEVNPASIPLSQISKWTSEGIVAYLGERKDVREILALADVVVLPSYWEGTPRVLLEAAAMGKPAVTTDVPGCRDVVEHQVTGLMVPPRDTGALSSAIETLLASSGLRDQFGLAARKKAEREFDEQTVIAKVLAEYDRLWEAVEERNT